MNTTQNQNTGQEGRAGSTHSQTGNGESIKHATDELKHGAEELRSKAGEIAQDAKQEGKAQVDEYRNVAAQKVGIIAESVKAAAAKLEEGDVGNWSSQISGMADSMTSFSQALRDKSADEVMRDVNRLARENPAIFIGSAVAIGFGLTRLMRASAPGPSGTTTRHSGYSSDRDDAYTSGTISGSGDSRRAGTAGGSSGSYASGGIGSGAASGSTGSYSGGGSGSSAGAGSSGTGLGGASSQAGQSGFAGTSGSQGSSSTRSGESHLGGNDRSKSS